MNNKEREQWINNDEGLYNWFRTSRERNSISRFIKENREDLDKVINAYLNREPVSSGR